MAGTVGRRGFRRRFLFPVFAVVFVPLFVEACATLLERALRQRYTVGALDPNFFESDFLSGFSMRRGSAGTYVSLAGKVTHYEINKLGCNDDPISGKPIDIVFLGDSCTFGDGLSDGEPSFIDRLETRLEAKSGKDLELLNAGVPGYCTSYATSWYEHELAPLKAKALVVWLGWNDRWWARDREAIQGVSRYPMVNFMRETALYRLGVAWLRVPIRRAVQRWYPEPRENYRPMVRLVETEKNLRDLAHIARAQGTEPIFLTNLSGARATEDVPEYVIVDRHLPDRQTFLDLVTVYNDIIRKVAREENVTLVDVERELAAEAPASLYTDPRLDSVHPDVRGHEKIAGLVYPELERLLY